VRHHAGDRHASFLADFLGNFVVLFPICPLMRQKCTFRYFGPISRVKQDEACPGNTLGYCPNVEAPFMDPSETAEAVEVLDLLLKFLGDGERWVKGRWSDRRGNRCLVGALDFVGSHYGINGEGAEHYLKFPPRRSATAI
jgi:hypothetical protein